MAMKCSGQSMVGMEQKNYKRRISQYLDLTLPCWMRILSWCYVQNETFGYSGLCLQFHEFDLHECPEEEEEGEGGRERERARARASARAREGGRKTSSDYLCMLHSDLELDCWLSTEELKPTWRMPAVRPHWTNEDPAGSIMSMIYPLHIQSRGCLGLRDQAIWQIDTTQQASVVRIPQFDVFLQKAQKNRRS